MKIKEVVSALEMTAPLPLQDGFDNAGMQVGLTEAEVTGALLCLDVTEEVVNDAIERGCNLIVAHHPLMFKPIKSITGRTYVERCLMKAIRNDVSIYAAHTNLDNAQGGVNAMIAKRLGLSNVRILAPKEESLLKLVTFVPTAQAGGVRRALFDAGCGCIGRYDSCSYNLTGEGTFKAGEGTNPYCGQVGELHTEPEVRIETILPAYRQEAVVKALLRAHPYEEPAYDLYPLKNRWDQAGSGAVGELEEPMTEREFLQRVKQVFDVACVRHSNLQGREIRKVALCGGAGAFLIPHAISEQADAFLTGEIRYHEYFGREKEILLAEIGHYESEQYTQDLLRDILSKALPSLRLEMTRVKTNPIHYL